MPPITELTRIEPVHLARLEHQGTFTTGLLLERTETPTELDQLRIEGLKDLLALSREQFQERIRRASLELNEEPPAELLLDGWWDQARTLEEE